MDILVILAVGVTIPAVVGLFIKYAKSEQPRREGGIIIFPVSLGLRLFGWFGALFFFALTIASTFHLVKDSAWWTTTLFLGFALLSVWITLGEIRVTQEDLEKRILGWKKFLPWDSIDVVLQNSIGPGGEVVVHAGEKKIKFHTSHAGWEECVKEIKARSPELID